MRLESTHRHLVVLIYILITSAVKAGYRLNDIDYRFCRNKSISRTHARPRKLFIATCETGQSLMRHSNKHKTTFITNDSLTLWNVSSAYMKLSSPELPMTNACKNISWTYKLLTKPILFHKYVTKLLEDYREMEDAIYVMLMDSDTYWSVGHIDEVWSRFDCVRGDKEMIVSTEMSCWMGFYCTPNDIIMWYRNLSASESYSPFANSGVYMGKATIIRDMLAYIIRNNQTYYTLDTYHHEMKFHDQHAVADYSIRISPHLIALDYHQQFAGTFTVRISNSNGQRVDKRQSAVCKNRSKGIDYHCLDISSKLYTKYKYFQLNESTCKTFRRIIDNNQPTFALTELRTLASHPIVWHGNGAAKKIYLQLGYLVYKCVIKNLKNIK